MQQQLTLILFPQDFELKYILPPCTLSDNMITPSPTAARPASVNELGTQYFLGCCRSSRRPTESDNHLSVPVSQLFKTVVLTLRLTD